MLNKSLLALFLNMIFFPAIVAQTSFQEGRIIDDEGKVSKALIKVEEWETNPISFTYKLDADGEVLQADITNVQEVITPNFTFVKRIVLMDQASDNPEQLDSSKEPTFKKERVFLKRLVEGGTTLYVYRNESRTRFFYKRAKDPIEPLIYKRYKDDGGNIRLNKGYQQQIWNSLTCRFVTYERIVGLQYTSPSLIAFFEDENRCENTGVLEYEDNVSSKMVSFTLRPRLNMISLSTESVQSDFLSIDFGSSSNVSIGLEGEFKLPIQDFAWSLIFEPTFHQFEAESEVLTTLNISTRTARIEYTSIQFPFGIRYRLPLGEKVELFANTSVVYDYVFDSSSFQNELLNGEVKSEFSFAFGIGATFFDRIHIETRGYTERRDIISQSKYRSSFQMISFVVGYSFFQK